MSWSQQQLRILRELGHEPMRLATVGEASGRDAGVREAQAQSRPQAAPAGAGLAALEAALLRAAGGRDVSALVLDLERLRREPALKRALWPRLRALRRGH